MTLNPIEMAKPYLFLLLLLVTVAVYGNTFRNEWSYDDIPVVVENPDAHSFAGFLENKRPGRPLRELSYIPEYKIFGDKPAGYHVQQILWHTANGFLVLELLLLLGGTPLAALLGSIFFLVHPFQVESVANISHRKELLALFFSLSALLAYAKALTEEGWKRWRLLPVTVLAYVMALLANETAVSLPAVLVLYESLYVGKERRLLLRKPLLLAVTSFIVAAALAYRYQWLFTYDQLLKVYAKNNFIASKSYLPLFMGVMKSFGIYLYKILLPMNFGPEYAVTFSESIFQPWAWLSMALIAGLILLAWRVKENAPLVSFGIGWFFILYLPVSNIFPVAYMVADRYMYMPIVGAAILFSSFCAELTGRRLWIVPCALLLVLGGLSIVQNTYWHDEHTLWRHAAVVNPDSTWAQESAAYSYYLKGDYETARKHAREALAINRYNTKAYLVLAQIEEARGDLYEAVKNYETFQSAGEVEYPDLVRDVRSRLPALKEKIRMLELYRRGG